MNKNKTHKTINTSIYIMFFIDWTIMKNMYLQNHPIGFNADFLVYNMIYGIAQYNKTSFDFNIL